MYVQFGRTLDEFTVDRVFTKRSIATTMDFSILSLTTRLAEYGFYRSLRTRLLVQ